MRGGCRLLTALQIGAKSRGFRFRAWRRWWLFSRDESSLLFFFPLPHFSLSIFPTLLGKRPISHVVDLWEAIWRFVTAQILLGSEVCNCYSCFSDASYFAQLLLLFYRFCLILMGRLGGFLASLERRGAARQFNRFRRLLKIDWFPVFLFISIS